MNRTTGWGGIVVVCVAVLSTGALGATGVLVSLDGPADQLYQLLDGNPATNETFRFEVRVDDPNGLAVADAYEYRLAVTGPGVVFDPVATEVETDGLVVDAPHVPRYLLFDDSLGVLATEDIPGDPTTILVSDLSDSGAPYDVVARPGLGIVVLKVTDDAAAAAGGGVHTITDGGVLLGSSEPLHIAPLQIVLPEPATVGLLLAGGLAVLVRRRRR